MKSTELKITLCLFLLFIIMIFIACCTHENTRHEEDANQTKSQETKVVLSEPEVQQSDHDVETIETEVDKTDIIEETNNTTDETTMVEDTEETIQYNEPQEEDRYQYYETLLGSEELGYNNALMLHKISIAEAGGESIESMAIIMLVILNRVYSENFPNSIEEVIFEKTDGVAQFTPTIDGNYDKAQPNEKSYEAMKLVLGGWDEAQGALYFEACENGSYWHSTTLEYLFEKDGVRYYK